MISYQTAKERLMALMAEARRKESPLLVQTPSLADFGETAAANHEQVVATHLINGRTQQLVALQAALWRLDSGTYGACLECGQEISEKRLRGVPEATFCCPCQTSRENRRT